MGGGGGARAYLGVQYPGEKITHWSGAEEEDEEDLCGRGEEWARTYVWKARVGEGPGERPAAGVALEEFCHICECIIRHLYVNGAIC